MQIYRHDEPAVPSHLLLGRAGGHMKVSQAWAHCTTQMMQAWPGVQGLLQ